MAEEDESMPPHNHGHEERIQKVEADVSDLKAQQAETQANVKFLSVQVGDLGTRISDKIDTFVKIITDKQLDEAKQIAQLSTTVDTHNDFIKDLDEEKKARAMRWDSWKKVIATAVTGALAIGLKELVVFIAHRFS